MNIRVRVARTADLSWLGQLMEESSIYNIPFGRDVSHDEVRKAARQDFQDIIEGAKDLVILVAENEELERLGVILLQLNCCSTTTGEPQSQVYSLAVEPKYWGTAAPRLLVEEAARITGEHGHRYMVGQVTADNRRMKLKAERMGFELEAYEIVMACTLDGPAAMPGRAENLRAHDVSRKQRRLLAKRRARKANRRSRQK
jgi:ribosomal protein S18 acetylase RimI-like enzyme